MFSFLCSLSIVLTILFIWFKTNAFVEYCKLFKLNFLLFNYKPHNLSFTEYLYTQKNIIFKNRFIIFCIDIITCPFCLSFWLCLLFASTTLNLLMVFPLYVCSLFLYLILIKLL